MKVPPCADSRRAGLDAPGDTIFRAKIKLCGRYECWRHRRSRRTNTQSRSSSSLCPRMVPAPFFLTQGGHCVRIPNSRSVAARVRPSSLDVHLLPEGDVNMKFLENHCARITAGRSKAYIAGMSRESYPGGHGPARVGRSGLPPEPLL